VLPWLVVAQVAQAPQPERRHHGEHPQDHLDERLTTAAAWSNAPAPAKQPTSVIIADKGYVFRERDTEHLLNPSGNCSSQSTTRPVGKAITDRPYDH